ncbi:hypothetical protein U2A4042360153 [Corynebacterium striatum]|nr:hypothetical protein U2A4042360153 [Corynebacterium striatum]
MRFSPNFRGRPHFLCIVVAQGGSAPGIQNLSLVRSGGKMEKFEVEWNKLNFMCVEISSSEGKVLRAVET